jgi:hypothetical protein
VWTQLLRNLSLQGELGVYIGAETGQGRCVKVAPRQTADAAGRAGQSHHPDAAGQRRERGATMTANYAPAHQPQLRLTPAERCWYVLGNIVTLGVPYFMKIQRKIAPIEVLNAERTLRDAR